MTPEERIEADKALAELGQGMAQEVFQVAAPHSAEDLAKILEAVCTRLSALSDPRLLLDRLTEDQFRVVFSMAHENEYTFGAVQHGIIDAFDRENLEPDYQQFVESCESAERVLTAIWLERLHQRAEKIQSLLDGEDVSDAEKIELLKKLLAVEQQAREQEKHQHEEEMESLRKSDQNGRENWDGIIDPISTYLASQDDYGPILSTLPEDGGPTEVGQSYIQLMESRRVWANDLENAIIAASNGFAPTDLKRDQDLLDYLADMVTGKRKRLAEHIAKEIAESADKESSND